MDNQRLHRVARRRLGLFTREDAAECGFSPYQIRHRLTTGEWQTVCGKVLAHRGRQLTPPVLAAAAHLAVPGSVVAGPSAALWDELPISGSMRWLWLARPKQCRLAGVGRLSDPLLRHDTMRADGVLITGPGRTVFDCLRVLPDDEALRVLDRAVQRNWTTLGEMVGRLRLFTGRHGAPRLVRILHAAGSGAHSAAERKAVSLLRAAGISGWAVNAEIYDEAGLIGNGDIVFRAARVVVEIDGRAFHSDVERFQRDRTRQNRLVTAGWTVLRFTWDDLAHRPAAVVATIRRALAS